MHDTLFQNQKALGEAQLKHYAEGLGLDMAAFEACLEDGRHADAVRADLAEGQGAGITGTPTFFLAVEGEDGALKTLQKIVGAQPYAAFKGAIDEALKERAKAPREG
jgi:predicted DsbA family dithiol-disulfide isomerase